MMSPNAFDRVEEAWASSAAADGAPSTLSSIHVDAHVHAYEHFNHAALLDYAQQHFQRFDAHAGLLCLTETARDHAFRDWRDTRRVGHWTVHTTDDPALLRVTRDHHALPLFVLAGRQIITADRLEVHALGVDAEFADGRDADDTIAAVRGCGALAVLPYGVGKWTGQRGRRVSQLIERYAQGGLLLGDNAGRITLGPRCPQFDQAAAHRMPLLPGTDPLPMPGTERHVATFGVVLEGPFQTIQLADQLKRQLAALGPVPRRFGDHLSPLHAIAQQLQLRLHKRKQQRTQAPA